MGEIKSRVLLVNFVLCEKCVKKGCAIVEGSFHGKLRDYICRHSLDFDSNAETVGAENKATLADGANTAVTALKAVGESCRAVDAG